MKIAVVIGVAALAAIIILTLILIVEAYLAARKPVPPFAGVPDRTLSFGQGTPELTYAVLGDSTAAGQGAPYERGIAVQTARGLAQDGRAVNLINAGVSGATFEDVLERQLPVVTSARPDLVLISVGANDLTHLAVSSKLENQLAEIVRRLREENPDVKIVYTGVPAMGTVPRFAQPLRALAGWQTKQYNDALRKQARELDISFVDLARKTAGSAKTEEDFFSSDGFHPSASGYEDWTEAILPVLKDALGPTS